MVSDSTNAGIIFSLGLGAIVALGSMQALSTKRWKASVNFGVAAMLVGLGLNAIYARLGLLLHR